MRKIAIADAAIIPPMTVEPRMRRATAPEPVANHNGKSPKMKAYKDKLSDADVKALVAYVRSLKK